MKFKIGLVKARHVGKIILGNKETEIKFVSNIHAADKDCLTFYTSNDVGFIKSIKAGIILVNENLKDKLKDFEACSIILTKNPMYDFAEILSPHYKNTFTENMIHLFLNEKIRISDNSYIEQKVEIGENTEIYPFVSIYNNTKIGKNCKIQSFTSIGSIGLAYVKKGKKYERFAHLGGVVLGHDVDVGSNVTIVKGILQNTIIGDGTKISNNVNIGHNVEIGKYCFISAGVTIAGSVKIEDECWIGPGATILNKVIIRRMTKIGIGAIVSKDADEDSFYLGYPARKIPQKED